MVMEQCLMVAVMEQFKMFPVIHQMMINLAKNKVNSMKEFLQPSDMQ
jgi:hypothetical protein